MAHPEQASFMKYVRDMFPEKFINCRVLDIGSLDINGNNRYLFHNYSYIGVDIGEGPNVDVVKRGHEFHDDVPFDIVISSECFEHDEFWDKTIENAIKLLKPGGIFLFSCATTGRPEHGTRRTTPQDSPFTSKIENDYYMNLTADDIKAKIPIHDIFEKSEFIQREVWPQDLYFWGIKKAII
jgi:SAM-dependent methyltransferase